MRVSQRVHTLYKICLIRSTPVNQLPYYYYASVLFEASQEEGERNCQDANNLTIHFYLGTDRWRLEL